MSNDRHEVNGVGVGNIFEGVDPDLVWESIGGHKFVGLIAACLIFIMILAVSSRWLGKKASQILGGIGILAILYFWIRTL